MGKIMMNATRAALLALGSLTLIPAAGFSQGSAPDLAQFSIEDLMKIEVTSASRKEQRAEDVAAAVFVITHDDIRRSGMTTIPDLLRMVPGVEVAQINSNDWAVTVRGFNGLYANKLLVLIDGRSIYNRIFAGVLWDTEDLVFDDIDRIEVVRGPGAAIWGANAVNGVINIVTKTANDTVGGLVRFDGGSGGAQATARYGGARGSTHYRVFSQWTGRDQSFIGPGIEANDASHSVTTGFRVDRAATRDALMFEGDFTAGQARKLWPNFDPRTSAIEPIADRPADTQGGNLLGRWTHTRPGGGSLQIQSFIDLAGRQETLGDYRRRVIDVDTQYRTALGPRQDLVAGAGYRFIDESFLGHFGLSLTPSHDNATLLTAFVQDEIALVRDRVALTLGSQVQHNSDSGYGVQPSARVMWKATPRQRVWAATSRALRTPALDERGFHIIYAPVPTAGGPPLVVASLGNPASKTETFVDVEGGYRLDVGTTVAIDLTGFAGRYNQLQTREVAAPVFQLVPFPQILVVSQGSNQLDATTRGVEIAGHWMPAAAWHFDGSYSTFHLSPHLAATSTDPSAATADGNAPGRQWQVRSAYSPAARGMLTVALFHVGRLAQIGVDAYTRADVTAEWRFNTRVSVMAIGQNLFDDMHAEFGGVSSLLLSTQVARSGAVRLRWTFR